MRRLVLLTAFLFPSGLDAQASADDERALRRLHAELIRAHLENDPALWMSIEGDDYVSANGGAVTFPSRAERQAGRQAYLEAATFTRYADLRDPIVRLSDDGSLGWLIAEVAIEGHTAGSDGREEPFADVWAWVELYQRGVDGWELIGNVSNRRTPD